MSSKIQEISFIGIIILIFSLLNKISLCYGENKFKTNFYDTGLIFYDPITKVKLLPPIITPLTQDRPTLRLPFIGQPCTCQNLICGCCAGILIAQYNIDQKMCVNASYIPQDLSLNLYTILNDQNIMSQSISARNPPPLCMPLMLPLPLAMCMKFSNMRFDDYNVHFCMDWVVRMNNSNDLFSMNFNCMKMGQGGLQYIDPMGKPVFPTNGNGFSKISEILRQGTNETTII